MFFAALLAVTSHARASAWFIRGPIRPNATIRSRGGDEPYVPVVQFAVRRRGFVIAGAALLILSTIPVF
jgi:Cu/Ag efflux pump CusA